MSTLRKLGSSIDVAVSRSDLNPCSRIEWRPVFNTLRRAKFEMESGTCRSTCLDEKLEYQDAGRLQYGWARGGLETGPDGDSRGDKIDAGMEAGLLTCSRASGCKIMPSFKLVTENCIFMN